MLRGGQTEGDIEALRTGELPRRLRRPASNARAFCGTRYHPNQTLPVAHAILIAPSRALRLRRHLALAQFVHRDRQNDDRSDDRLLQIRAMPSRSLPFESRPMMNAPISVPDHAAFAAAEAAAADDDRGDGLQLVALAGGRLPVIRRDASIIPARPVSIPPMAYTAVVWNATGMPA